MKMMAFVFAILPHEV